MRSMRQSEQVVRQTNQRQDDRARTDLAAGEDFDHRIEKQSGRQPIANVVCKYHNNNSHECRHELSEVIEVDAANRAAGLTTMMYAIETKMVMPPRTSVRIEFTVGLYPEARSAEGSGAHCEAHMGTRSFGRLRGLRINLSHG